MQTAKTNGIKAFQQNQDNYFRELKRLFTLGDYPLNESSEITVLYNEGNAIGKPAISFKLEIWNDTSTETAYYPIDFIRYRGEQLDWSDDREQDVLVTVIYGDELIAD